MSGTMVALPLGVAIVDWMDVRGDRHEPSRHGNAFALRQREDGWLEAANGSGKWFVLSSEKDGGTTAYTLTVEAIEIEGTVTS